VFGWATGFELAMVSWLERGYEWARRCEWATAFVLATGFELATGFV
jgi:hypothetical protein